MTDTSEFTPPKALFTRARCQYSAPFKSDVVQACLAQGATTLAVAQRYGLRRDLVGRWLLIQHRQTQPAEPKFVD